MKFEVGKKYIFKFDNKLIRTCAYVGEDYAVLETDRGSPCLIEDISYWEEHKEPVVHVWYVNMYRNGKYTKPVTCVDHSTLEKATLASISNNGTLPQNFLGTYKMTMTDGNVVAEKVQ